MFLNIAKFILFFTLLIQPYKSQRLILFDLETSTYQTDYYLYYNIPGFSFDWQIIGALNTSLFKTLMKNAILSMDWDKAFGYTFRSKAGVCYNYDASQTICSINITSLNITNLGNLLWDAADNPYNVIAGIQFENPNNTQMKLFREDLYKSSFLGFYLQFGEKVDEYTSRGIRPSNYDMNQYIKQIKSFLTAINRTVIRLAGPGVNYRSKNWMDNMTAFFNSNSYSYFTIQVTYFENDQECTIENLLSQQFMKNKFNEAFLGYQSIIYNQFVAVSTLRLHHSNGINGITNTFAACLWGLDFITRWAVLGGVGLNFYTNLSQFDYQSPFTSLSNFSNPANTQVNSLYYSLMAFNLFKGGELGWSNVGISTLSNFYKKWNIRTYTITDGSGINILIINKDLDRTFSGYFRIRVKQSLKIAKYFYLQAHSLLDTTQITLTGYTYDNTTSGVPSNPLNKYQIYKSEIQNDGYFYIPLQYSQAVIIYLIDGGQLISEKKWNQASWGQNLQYIIAILMLIIYI